MILTGLLHSIRTLSGIVPKLVAMEALDLTQILLLLLLLVFLARLDLSSALLALGYATFACEGKVLLVLNFSTNSRSSLNFFLNAVTPKTFHN